MIKRTFLATVFPLLFLFLSLGCSDKDRLLITSEGPEDSRILRSFTSHFGIMLGEWWQESYIEGSLVVRVVENETSSLLSVYVRPEGREEFFVLRLRSPLPKNIPYVAAGAAVRTARFILELVMGEERPKTLIFDGNREMKISGFFVFRNDFR